jgi:hypothetical protein
MNRNGGMMRKIPLLDRKQIGVGVGEPLAFSGQGIAPDLQTERGLATFPEANKTTLEEGIPYGADGMLPAPGYTGKLVPGWPEGGRPGAGTFDTSSTQPLTRT